KSGALWLRYGDRNSSFFHRSANSRKKRNWIDRLIVDGQEFVGQRDISSPIVNHFKHFFEEPLPENRPLPRNLPFAKINSVQATTISRQFSEEEVWRCIQISESEKAPGPDGFNMGFIKHCWSFIKSDFMNALWDFQSSSIIPKGANSTFICLIPKKDSVRDIKDLRPISLIGIFYKILSKCLMCRFRSCLKEVISSPQCAFLDGRQISEASLLANEIIDSRRSSGKNGLVFKLDLEKAFDSVNWECIIFMLERFNFPPIWISWIRSCISSAHFSILINGAAEGYFENHRGIRQGLKINFSKSRIFAVGNVQNINEMAHIFGCAVDTFPTSYLGLPLGCKPTLSVIWNPVITSIQSKLDSWKVRHLSFGGRLVLIKHVLGAMPFYFMTLFKAPCRIIKKIEQLQRTFLWSGNSESRKFHGVCWNQTKASRTRGGLGILDLRCMNSALLSKWIWKYASQPSAWWRSLLDTKNGLSTSTWKMSLREGFGSWSVWRRIMTCESDFWKIGFVDPGRGLNTSFWHDSWVRGEVESLKSSYPRVFAASIDKEACIADIFCRDDRSWNLQLNVSLRGGAATELFELRLLLDSLSGDMLARDVEGLHWPLENSSSFTVRSMYSHLATQRFRGLPDFPTNRIWLQMVPSKICCFLWLCCTGKIATLDVLKQKGWSLANRCFLCEQDEESTNHLFLHCNFSSQIWNHFALKMGFTFVRPDHTVSLVRSWSSVCPTFMSLASALPHAIIWTLWLERNRRLALHL
ncbi:Putative ribonuclease H protein At1g65750, partial [Linum grandiflorum]